VNNAVELAIQHALGLARTRGGRLASVTIEGPVDVVRRALAALAAAQVGTVEVHHLEGTVVRLAAVEIERGEKTGFAVLSTSEPPEGRVGKPPHRIKIVPAGA